MVPVKIFLTVSCVAVLLVVCASAPDRKKRDELTDLLNIVYGMEVLGHVARQSCSIDCPLLFCVGQKLNPDALAVLMATSCSDFCQSGGFGDGVIIGTAPFCDGQCGRDCTTHCTIASLDWDDYGAGCWTGNKICCCAKSLQQQEFEIPKPYRG